MPKAYQIRNNWQQKTRCPMLCRAWFVGGLFVGIIFSSMIWSMILSNEGSKTILFAKTNVVTEEKKPPEDIKFEYDFYKKLAEVSEITAEHGAEQRVTKSQNADPSENHQIVQLQSAKVEFGYELQVGAFKGFADANRQKAQLAMLGVVSNIRKIGNNEGETLFRVRGGPYTQDQMLAVRNILRQHNIESNIYQVNR